MSICRRTLTIALRHPLYLAIYVGFLSAMGVLLMGEAEADATRPTAEAARARIALIDRDDSAVSAALETELGTTDDLIAIDDEPLAMQDALATGSVDAVLIVPAEFGTNLISAAQNEHDLPELELAAGSDIQASALASQHASRWASLVAARAALEPEMDESQVIEAVREAAKVEPLVEVLDSTPAGTATSRLAFYLTFSSFTVTSSVIVVAGVVLTILSGPDLRRRLLASPVSTWRAGIGAVAGCGILTLGVCMWVAATGIATSGAVELLSNAAPQTALAIAALLVFSLVPLALAYTLAQCGFGEEALNAIANLGGMVMSFLGGAWVPLSLMGEGLRVAAHFTPTFWMHDAVTCALSAQAVTPQILAAVGIDLSIITLFAAAIVSVGLVVSRLRVRES